MARAEAAKPVPHFSSRRLLLIAVLGLAVLVAFVAVQNLASSAVYYLTPTEARDRHIAPHQAARLGGLVLPGTLHYDGRTGLLTFTLSDGTTSIAVVGNGAPPSLLREDAGAVVEGEFAEDDTFRATSVIAKHDENYAPPSPGKTPAHGTP